MNDSQSRPSEAELVRQGRRITWAGIWVNLGLTLAKLAAGWFGRSQALIADAAHSLSDLISDGVVLMGLRLGRRSSDQDHHFGHGRQETIASLVVGILLAVAAVAMGFGAVQAIYLKQAQTTTWPAPLAAAVSILSKELLYHYTVRTGRRLRSPLLIANAWHHRSDALSSVAALLGAGGAAFYPSWWILDPVAAMVVSLLVLKVGLQISQGAIKELSDTAPSGEVMQNIETCALQVEGVRGIHDLRVRSSGGLYQAEVHVVVDGSISVHQGHGIAKEVERCLLGDIDGMGRVIVHIDPYPQPAEQAPPV